MANDENLIPLNERSKEDAKKIRQAGAYARAEAMRKRKTMREMLDYLLQKEIVNNKTGEKVTTQEALLSKQIQKSIAGDTKAAQFVRDTVGDFTQKLDITQKEIKIEVANETDKDLLEDL